MVISSHDSGLTISERTGDKTEHPPGLCPAERFTPEEAVTLRRYFTNIDLPVFGLMNLPEVVKGALFARYSRSPLSLRRLFLEEFADGLHVRGDATVGLRRAEQLYDRVFFEYGDDSVAQLGGVHLACEHSSNLLTKVLEWGRLMSYLEQSTRYIIYDRRVDGRFRYFRDPELVASPFGARYVDDLDKMFRDYSSLVTPMRQYFRDAVPKALGDSDVAYRHATKARALDAVRGMLPAATLSNVGIYGTGQAYEALLLRMRAHPLPEARTYADMMLVELRKMIPSFLKRVDLPDRGQITSRYMADNQSAMDDVTHRLFEEETSHSTLGNETGSGMASPNGVGVFNQDDPDVELVDFDPEGEEKMIAAMLYPHTSLPESAVLRKVQHMTIQERRAVMLAYCGNRTNRRHRPGRALERTFYRFDVLSDYGAFRDLQRHRMLTIEWQPLSTRHGYVTPPEVTALGVTDIFERAMARSAELYDVLVEEFPYQAPYAVALAYRVRYSMQFNAREAMHMLELRTSPQGHISYRQICRKMHRLIAEQAGHTAVASMMSYVDHGNNPVLGRLEAENTRQRKAGR